MTRAAQIHKVNNKTYDNNKQYKQLWDLIKAKFTISSFNVRDGETSDLPISPPTLYVRYVRGRAS